MRLLHAKQAAATAWESCRSCVTWNLSGTYIELKAFWAFSPQTSFELQGLVLEYVTDGCLCTSAESLFLTLWAGEKGVKESSFPDCSCHSGFWHAATWTIEDFTAVGLPWACATYAWAVEEQSQESLATPLCNH